LAIRPGASAASECIFQRAGSAASRAARPGEHRLIVPQPADKSIRRRANWNKRRFKATEFHLFSKSLEARPTIVYFHLDTNQVNGWEHFVRCKVKQLAPMRPA
jgi:hypothetical protein